MTTYSSYLKSSGLMLEDWWQMWSTLKSHHKNGNKSMEVRALHINLPGYDLQMKCLLQKHIVGD